MYNIKVVGVMQMLLFYISSEDANFSEKEIIMKLTGKLKEQVEKTKRRASLKMQGCCLILRKEHDHGHEKT